MKMSPWFGLLVGFLGLSSNALAADRTLTVTATGLVPTNVFLSLNGMNHPQVPCVLAPSNSCVISFPGSGQGMLQFGEAAGTIRLSGTGLCAGASTAAVPVTIPASGTLTCGIKGIENSLKVTSDDAASIAVDGQPKCAISNTSPCEYDNLATGTTTFTVTPAAGSYLKSAAGICGAIMPGVGARSTTFPITKGAQQTCSLALGSPYFTVSASGSGLTSLTAGSNACLVGDLAARPQVWACPYGQNGETVSLTPGVATGIVLAGGSGACAGASPTGPPFDVVVTSNTIKCDLVTGSNAPENGLWSAGSGNYLTLARDPAAKARNSVFGAAMTYGMDGKPLWYMLNATWDQAAGGYLGTASEFTTGSNGNAAPRMKAITANISLTFESETKGNLVWNKRPVVAGQSAKTIAITRHAQGGNTPPFKAPNGGAGTGWYAMAAPLVEGERGYFVEAQTGAGGNTAVIVIHGYDSSGVARWRASALAGTSLTAGSGLVLSAPMLKFMGGSPIGAASPSAPTPATDGAVTATLSPGKVDVAASSTGVPTGSFTPYQGWGLASSPYWVSLLNNDTLLTAPYVTFFPGSTSSGGFKYIPTSGATAGQLTDFPNYTSVLLSDLDNAVLLASSLNLGGNLYFSEAGLQVSTGSQNPACVAISPSNQQAPSPVSTGDCNYKTRWQFAELGGVYDITYINFYSVPLSINQGALSYGEITKSGATFSGFKTALGNLTTTAQSAFVTSNGKFVRANSPANAGATLKDYPSLSGYLGAAFSTSGTPTTAISISNAYSATTPDAKSTICTKNAGKAFAAQTYSASVTYDATSKALTITGTASAAGAFTIKGWTPVASPPATCKGSIGAKTTCYDTGVSPKAFSQAIYTAVLNYSVDNPACSASDVESNGANDVFSAVVRDMLVGLASGFVNSAQPSPAGTTPATTYGTMKSSQWSADAGKLFGGVQKTSPYYNTWAGAVYDTFGSRVYGFQYSDFFTSDGPIGNPQLSLRPSMPAQIVVLQE